ncbi:helicase associated domain-containing protein [Streptomyces sp. NPDC054834]
MRAPRCTRSTSELVDGEAMPLGVWISQQRAKANQLSAQRVEELSALDMCASGGRAPQARRGGGAVLQKASWTPRLESPRDRGGPDSPPLPRRDPEGH